MNKSAKISGISSLVWAISTLIAFGLMIATSFSRGGDVYDIARGLQAISEQPFLLVAAHLLFGWMGAALVFMTSAYHHMLPTESRSSLAKAGTYFGLLAAGLFLFYGLVGGLGYSELSYIQSVRSTDYVSGAYLPLTIITNRALAAAVAVSGFWFVLTNWDGRQFRLWPTPVAYLGMGTGLLALLGFFLPGGGFSILSLLLGPVWGILVALHLIRARNAQAASV